MQGSLTTSVCVSKQEAPGKGHSQLPWQSTSPRGSQLGISPECKSEGLFRTYHCLSDLVGVRRDGYGAPSLAASRGRSVGGKSENTGAGGSGLD